MRHQALGLCRCGSCHTIGEAISLNDPTEGGGMTAGLDAIAQLCATAVDLQRWGTKFELQVQGLTRDEYDRFDGEDVHFPPTPERPKPFWSKRVELYVGDFDHESGLEGDVTLTLYTLFAPVAVPVSA